MGCFNALENEDRLSCWGPPSNPPRNRTEGNLSGRDPNAYLTGFYRLPTDFNIAND